MKNHFKDNIKKLLGSCLIVFVITSCEYKDIADAEYPNQTVYLPAARQEVYKIEKSVTDSDAPVQYVLDKENSKVILLMSVYRAGINNKGSVIADIVSDAKAVSDLITSGDLTTIHEDGTSSTPILLPENKYTYAQTVEIKSGEETGSLEIMLDLPYLISYPHTRFAFAVKIADSNVSVNEKLATVIIDFNTKVLVPDSQ